MIQSIQKVIKIGSSGGVTIPAKELKRQHISFGDDVEVIVRPVRSTGNSNDEAITAARKILKEHQKDFTNLAKQ